MPDSPARAGAVVVDRDVLATGHVVSTVLLAGTLVPYETVAFSPGWPRVGDEIARVRTATLTEALDQHAALVRRLAPESGANLADPNWVSLLLGLPPRRYPRGRP